jgi:ATP-dependent RNA helicase DDX42
MQGQVGEACEDVTQIVKVMPPGGAKWNWLIEHLVEFTSAGEKQILTTVFQTLPHR